ncbi:MAG: hypothetical protein ACE5JH_06370 [Acidobacteriota bacterium]
MGSALVALAMSLGSVVVLRWVDLEVSPWIPAVSGAVGAAAFAARLKEPASAGGAEARNRREG